LAKANIALKNGTTVEIDGTAEEVAALLAKFSQVDIAGEESEKRLTRKPQHGGRKASKPKKDGPTGLIGELADQGYFKSKRSISDIQQKLEEGGHVYPVTSISPCLTRMTKRRQLRRIKDEKGWQYVS
jgi:hypothetical protein